MKPLCNCHHYIEIYLGSILVQDYSLVSVVHFYLILTNYYKLQISISVSITFTVIERALSDFTFCIK